MFPYKVRKPAWGTLKPKEESKCRSIDENEPSLLIFDAKSQLGGDPNDPHTIGGNLQRAILLDMIELRHRYCCSEKVCWTSASASTPRQQSCSHKYLSASEKRDPIKTQRSRNHAALGSSFSRFKDCFRNARFGAIHTRTIPPRVDRGEYIQLIYSSCFYLLEESFKFESASDDTLFRWDVLDTSHPHCALNAVYAVFILYTLHQTNVLPMAPPPRSHNVAQRTKSENYHLFHEDLLKEAWSMLPIGINSDEDKLYRRTFRSPVRIDRWNYLLLLRLRDLCLAQVDQCGMDAVTNATSGGSSSSSSGTCNNSAEVWQCHCGLACDAAYIIDKMLTTDAFFEYCEYHGPHSLEGLAGSPNFYRAYFANSPKKKTKGSKNDGAIATSAADFRLKASENNKFETEDDISSSLELQKLVKKHCSSLKSVAALLQRSRLTGDELQPKQRELVENTLSNVLDPSKYSVMSKKLNDKDSSNLNVSNGGEAEFPDEQHATKTPEDLILSFPDSFSVALRSLLQDSFADFIEETKMLREAVVKENKARVRGKQLTSIEANIHSDVALFDDFISVTASDTPTLINLEHQTKCPWKNDEFLELQQEEFDEDDFSTTTGAGKNALLSLLSAAGGNELPIDACLHDDEFSVVTGAGKNALRALLSLAGGNNNCYDSGNDSLPSDDDISGLPGIHSVTKDNPLASLQTDDSTSVVSGMGMRALNLLLSGHAGMQTTQTAKNRVRKKTSKLPPKKVARKPSAKKNGQRIHSKKNQPDAKQPNPISKELPDAGSCAKDDDDDDSSSRASDTMELSVVTVDAGRNALAKLLSNTK